MREKIIEEKLTKAVKQNGGVCWKFTSPGTAGVPDRIVLMPGGRIAFVDACEDIDKIIWEVKNGTP